MNLNKQRRKARQAVDEHRNLIIKLLKTASKHSGGYSVNYEQFNWAIDYVLKNSDNEYVKGWKRFSYMIYKHDHNLVLDLALLKYMCEAFTKEMKKQL